MDIQDYRRIMDYVEAELSKVRAYLSLIAQEESKNSSRLRSLEQWRDLLMARLAKHVAVQLFELFRAKLVEPFEDAERVWRDEHNPLKLDDLIQLKKPDYDIIAEVKEIAEQHDRPPSYIKPDEWRELGTEIHSLYFRCKELDEELPEQFYEAVHKEDWRRALLVYMAEDHKPLPPPKRLPLDSCEWYWDEDELSQYVTEARSWIAETEELLAS